jgi:hypothetical protein
VSWLLNEAANESQLTGRALMAHACNPSYSGGRDQEDRGSKPTRANRVYLEKTYHKKQLMEWLKVKVLSSSPSTAKKKKKKRSAYVTRHSIS